MVDKRDDKFWMGRMQLRTSLIANFSKHTNINQNSQNHFNVSLLLFLPGEYLMLYGSTTKVLLLTCNDFSVVTCGFSAFHTIGNKIDIRCVVRFVFIENWQVTLSFILYDFFFETYFVWFWLFLSSKYQQRTWDFEQFLVENILKK